MKKIIYQNEHNYVHVSQSFNQFEPEYQYDEKTGNLVEVGKIDSQKKIESFKDQELRAVLDRFGVEDVSSNLASKIAQDAFYNSPGKIFDGRVKDDLDEYGKLLERTEKLKEKYSLSPDMTVSEVYKYLGNLANQNKANIEKFTKGVNKDAQRTQDESKKEQENISQLGKEDPQEESK